ncbi:MAG: WD40 repeat domain-containing protein, partial [bacterium]
AAVAPINAVRVAAARAVTALAFSPNGLYLASGADDGSIAVWEFGGRTLLARAAAGGGGVAALAWAPADQTRDLSAGLKWNSATKPSSH